MKLTVKTRLILFIALCFFLVIGTAVVLPQLGRSSAEDTDSYSIYYGGKLLPEKGYYIKNTVYAPVSIMTAYGDMTGMTLDIPNGKVNIDLSKRNIMMADDTTTNFVKTYAGTVYVPLKKFDNALYFPMNTLKQFLKLSPSISGSRIQIQSYRNSDGLPLARISQSDAILTPSPSSGEGNKVRLSKGQQITIKEETENYYLVETADGDSGYVLKSVVVQESPESADVDFYAPKKDKYVQGQEKLSLVWQYVGGVTEAAPSSPNGGIDVLAPTWFDLIVNGDGSVSNEGDLGYTQGCHANGYMVWATITNSMSTSGSTNFTTKVFQDSAMLNKSVAQYLFYSCLYDADGINIDYEQVKDDDAAGLVAFTALLRSYTERQGLNLSIDVSIPASWTIEYDRPALAKHVDYIAVMTYDQHYGGSTTAGSVATLPWAEKAITDTLKQVPAEKILMGMPMYTRIWTVDENNKVIKNPSATMPAIQKLIAAGNLKPTWLTAEKQYFLSYPEGDYTSKIWIEDSRSMAHRLNLVQKYNLAGSASWQRSQASDDIWLVFQGMLKEGKALSTYDIEKY